jgi:uncharacterized protein (TIGR03437 family)
VCHKNTKLVRWATLVAIGWSAVWAQNSPDPAALKWRRIGNDAVEVPLAAPATGPVDAVWFAPDGSRLYALVRSGGVFETVDFENWSPAAAAPAPPADASVTVERAPEPNVRFVGVPASSGRVFALGQHLFRSDDGGKSWLNLTAYRTQSVIGSGQHSLAISRLDPDQVVVANDYGVWRSTDGGLSWSGLNQGLPALRVRRILATPNGAIGARIVVEGFGPLEWQPGNTGGWLPLDPAINASAMQIRRAYEAVIRAEVVSFGAAGDTVYAGTADGNVFVSFDRGRSFRKSNNTSFGGPVESVFVDSAEPSRALVAVAGQGARILRTTNSGNFWDDLSANLPAGAAHAVVADRAAGAVYAATDAGIFFARADLENPTRSAPEWVSLRTDARGRDVKLDPTGNQLYIALDGYGVFATPAPHRSQMVRLVNAADFSNRPAAPGSLVSVLGARVNSAKAGELNFPVLAASEGESQIQVPFETAPATVPLALDTTGRRVTFGLPVQAVSPTIFVGRDGAPMLQDADSGLMLDPRNAARSNSRIQVFATGLGRVRPDWPTGLAAPLEQPPAVTATVRAYLDRAPVAVTHATLAPGYVGLYLIEMQLPAIVNAGPAELYISADGQESNRVQVYLEP